MVVAAGEDALPIRRERDGGDRIRIALELADQRAGSRVPQTQAMVVAAGEDAVPIRRERDGIDVTRMALELADQRAGLGDRGWRGRLHGRSYSGLLNG